jgi:hypothetical protein
MRPGSLRWRSGTLRHPVATESDGTQRALPPLTLCNRSEVIVSQINVNPGSETSTSEDRSAAAGINFLTVFVVLAVVIALLWFLFTGPFRSGFGGGNTNIEVNPPAQQAPPPNINVNPPSNPVNPPSNPVNPPSNPVNPPAAPSKP